MNIYISSDHRGFLLKNELKNWLGLLGHSVIDVGPSSLDPLDDYPDFVHVMTAKILSDEGSLGITICGSGVGVSITANRRHYIRAGLCLRPDQAEHARVNDHMNVLALASDYTPLEEAKKIVAAFLSAKPATEEKFLRRVKKIEQIA